MKFLHLSDLHIGKSVNGFSMLEEQAHVFKQVKGYVHSHKPEAVVIAGDIYDRSAPGADAVRVFDVFLTELAETGAAVMFISGNHDSPERLSYASRLLCHRGVHARGVFDGSRPVTLADQYGPVNFWLMPFVKPSMVQAEGAAFESYTDAFAAVLATADIDFDQRNVIVAHQFFTRAGVLSIRSDSEIDPVGGLDAIDASVLSRFDYAALGHLHGAQRVGGDNIRYAGSPLKYSFSECRQEKSITLVELCEKGRLAVTALPLTPIRDMREIKGTLAELMSAASANEEPGEQANGDLSVGREDGPPYAGRVFAASLRRKFREDYLRVILTDEAEIIDPMGKIRSVYPNVMVLAFENSRTRVDLGAVSTDMETSGAGALSPYELFNEFFLEISGAVMNAEQEKIVKALLEKADEL
ncbi:MAG: exonuclease SbcCD subunit D [Clostridiales bacterium]|jgi:exonuclease SbcD|nr:exonuclease SbcCD subunit D [Clostridiales bacterium]